MPSANFTGLSKRQMEVLRLAHGGLGTKDIGAALGITNITVASHLNSARKKIGVRSTRDAAAKFAAFEAGENAHLQNTDISNEDIIHVLLMRIDDFELSVRTANVLIADNRVFVGDLVQLTEFELLRLPNFGRRALNEIKEMLASVGLRLGMVLSNWPPDNIEQVREKLSIAAKVRGIPQAKLGTTFRAGQETLEIAVDGNESDESAALESITQQLHQESKRKLEAFSEATKTLSNQYGWSDIDASNRRFVSLLDRPTEDIPAVIGLVYSSALELGSYLELDNQLRSGEVSYAESLRPEVRRLLEDVVKTVAPWVRRFPSAREIDNETGEFLSQITLVAHAREATETALRSALIAEDIAETVRALLASSDRAGAVSYKASTRGVLSARNMVIAAATAATTVWLGAVGSELAPQSVLAQRAAGFLASAEAPIVQLFKDLPSDIQLAINMLIKEVNQKPFTVPSPLPDGRRPIAKKKHD
ncbi:DNA-directed RNA polymerase subunit alpha C-terminal domain-containing protein [Agrobacterium albertimagni]